MTGEDWRHLGCTLYAGGNYTTAIAAFLRARAQGAKGDDFQREFAVTLWAAGDRTAALQEISKATRGKETSFEVAVTIASFLNSMGDPAGAARWSACALLAHPDDAQARFNHALYVLASGNWLEGFELYESRENLYRGDHPKMSVPRWKGEALRGKTIWITAEQGIGDEIQFSRYLPWLQQQGAHIIFDAHEGTAAFYEPYLKTRRHGPAGKFINDHLTRPDFYCSLLSLAAMHRTTQENMPPPVGWYHRLAAGARIELPNPRGKKKIGVVWAGSDHFPGNKTRSIPLADLAPLFGDDDCEFYSFQVGPHEKDVTECGAQALLNRVLSLQTWPQTASALLDLDALVTTCTGIAHLAGSLGVRTFLMLSSEPDWRWGVTGDETPWYPSMKLVRQDRPGDWHGVVRKVGEELRALK